MSGSVTYLEAIVIGLVQGVTELFPVSSLGHAVLIPAFIGGSWASTMSLTAKQSPYLALVVALHVATAAALLLTASAVITTALSLILVHYVGTVNLPTPGQQLTTAQATRLLTRMGEVLGPAAAVSVVLAFIVDTVLALDPKNPQVAARLLSALKSWRVLEPGRRARAEAALRRVAAAPSPSPDVSDIVQRALAND